MFAAEFFFFGRIFTSSLDIQTWISWVSDIKIKRFKNPNSFMRVGLQLYRMIRGEIKSFYRTESGRNLVGKKMVSWSDSKTDEYQACRYDWEYNLRIKTRKIVTETEFLVQLWSESCSRQNFYQIFKQEYLELLISKSGNSKAQIHLCVQNYKFDEGFEVR
jgi:hypothetical protein